jgi:hypothetical protein
MASFLGEREAASGGSRQGDLFMRRMVCRWLVVLAPVIIAGCSSDPRDEYIDKAVKYINDAANELGAIKDRVNAAIKGTKDNKLSAKELREASANVETLRDLGKKMQLVKQQTDGLGASTNDEEKADLRQRYQKRVQDALATLEEERVALQKTLQEAEAIDPDGIRDLRNQLTQAEGIFAVLARPR